MNEFQEKAMLDVSADSRREVKCGDCKWRTYDMDGNYCGHKKSYAVSGGFGQSLYTARCEGGVCGPDGKLWEIADDSQS